MDAGPDVVAGVDTHKDTHFAAVITTTGRQLGAAEFPASEAGYRELTEFITGHGPLLRAGVEGTNAYGAGLSRHLHTRGVPVVEVLRPARQVRRMRGKSDEIDAYAAAQIALAGVDTVTAKTTTGLVEAIRVTFAARRSAVKARAEVITQIKSLLIAAPEPVRAQYRHLTTGPLISALVRTRPRGTDDEVAARTRTALKRLATRTRQLDAEIDSHNTDLDDLLTQVNPGMLQVHGINTVTAAQLLITAGDNPDRIGSEAAFAMLCGAAPIPASSGKTTRHRLNRGGDRHANAALHHIAKVRLRTDPQTRAYAARLTAAGKSKKDILRCLKRAIARQVFRLITHPPAIEHSHDLRPARQELGLTLADVAEALGCSTNKVSRLERGDIRDVRFLHHYRAWLTDTPELQIAA